MTPDTRDPVTPLTVAMIERAISDRCSLNNPRLSEVDWESVADHLSQQLLALDAARQSDGAEAGLREALDDVLNSGNDSSDIAEARGWARCRAAVLAVLDSECPRCGHTVHIAECPYDGLVLCGCEGGRP